MSFPDDDPRHGTYAGAGQHNLHGTPLCGPCVLARKNYYRDWRIKNGPNSKFTFPVSLSLPAYEMDGVGLTIARAIRESA